MSITGNTLQNPALPGAPRRRDLRLRRELERDRHLQRLQQHHHAQPSGRRHPHEQGQRNRTISGSITNNTIGTTGVNRSGSIEASGIMIGARGAGGTHTTLIEDNNIFGWTTARSSSRTARETQL